MRRNSSGLMIWVSLRAPLEMRELTQPSIQATNSTSEVASNNTTSQPAALDAASISATAISR